MGVISFYDVAKAVVDSQDFENRMLKAYIRDWPVEEPRARRGRAEALSGRCRSRASAAAAAAGRAASLGSASQRPMMSGSTFGDLFRVTNFGESHGPAIGCVIDGCPPGMALSEADIQPDLDRRRPGTSRHVTQRNEADAVEILSGVYEGLTTGTPIALLIRNTDQRSKDYGNLLDTFRPGHADYTYWHKYGLRDPRGGGRASARLTAPMVAAGAVAKKWLREQHGTRFVGWMSADRRHRDSRSRTRRRSRTTRSSRPTPAIVPQLEAYMDALRKAGDSCGARITVAARGVPVGPGRAAVRQARRRHRLRDDGHQRRQGRGDRRRLRRRHAEGQRARRRADARRAFAATTPAACSAASPPGRTWWCRIAIKPTSSIRLPRASIDRAGAADHGGDHRPPRPLRGHPRHADRRGACWRWW